MVRIDDNRGQAITFEAVMAVFILTSSLVFGYAVLAINDNSLGQTRNLQEEVADSNLATSLLESSAEQEIIKPTVLYWDDSNAEYYDTDSEYYYTTKQPPTEFGTAVTQSYDLSQKNINIEAIYWEDSDGDGTLERQSSPIVWTDDPDETATTSTYTITLYDSDELRDSAGFKSGTTLSGASTFYIPDVSSSEVYNVVTIKVTIWD